ncbi:MAG: TetR/AcrR family transcriptional regulator [Fluviicoccus sp.]|uniref:TetR/AcrR family transcriptional regulator n=1 Tax=Fluviicoccus sp. TaxID=2003552 RepID=UPI0027188B01|nr:TetR/AcrR family transcriptional regulator [Fluviicoccus sp.]MDO8330617.1 TetR/AcrR family transcriptional regulator [Fluviicoccus sp.]
MTDSAPLETPPRSRGRPRIAGDELTTRQAPVLEAAGRLLATRASGDISVELLLQETGTSRPSFYRWFPGGMEQVFEQVIAQANSDLVSRLLTEVARVESTEARIRTGVRAYFDWGLAQGPVVAGIYREGFTEGSIAQRYRRQTIDSAIALIGSQAEGIGLGGIKPSHIETLVSWVETAGAVIFRHYPVSRDDVDDQCEMTTRMFLTMLRQLMADHGITLD